MKKYLILIALISAVMFTSCKHEVEPVATTFEITVSDVTATEALVSVAPSDSTTWYYFDVISVEYLDEYENDGQLTAEYLEWIQEEVDYYAKYGYEADFTDWLSQGNDEYFYEALSPNTEYVAFAFAVDSNYEWVGDVYKVPFKTPELENVLLTFELAQTDTALWFLPNDDNIVYFPTFVSTDTLAAYEITAAEFYQAEIDYYGEYIAWFTSKGPVYINYSVLNPGETYVFLAQAYSAGEWNSDLYTVEFAAPGPEVVPSVDRVMAKRSLSGRKHFIYKGKGLVEAAINK